MKTLSLSEAKMKLSALVNEVCRTDEEVVITKNGVPAAILVSPDQFESWRETMAIRFDKDSMKEIRDGLVARKVGRLSTHWKNCSKNSPMSSGAVSHRLCIPTEVAELIRGLHPYVGLVALDPFTVHGLPLQWVLHGRRCSGSLLDTWLERADTQGPQPIPQKFPHTAT